MEHLYYDKIKRERDKAHIIFILVRFLRIYI